MVFRILLSPLTSFQTFSNLKLHSLHLKFVPVNISSFGSCVPKFYFQLNQKWHCLDLKCILDPVKPLYLISNFFKPKIAFFAFKICIGEYILCSFGLCVPKFYLLLNLKWHCLHLTHLTGVVDTLKPLYLISNFFKPRIAFFAFKVCIHR